MKRDKKFYIDSIKMDLFRVVTASGDVSKDLPHDSVMEFLNHAHSDLSKIKLTLLEKKLKDELASLITKLEAIKGVNDRLRWAEDILTIRCRL